MTNSVKIVTKKPEVEVHNDLFLKGVLATELEFSHEVFSEKFYKFTINVERLSGVYDSLQCLVSEKLADPSMYHVGDLVSVNGEIRTYNLKSENEERNHLEILAFVKEIFIHDDPSEEHVNSLEFTGFICKKPNYRTTPLGREICDLIIAVNRYNNKSNYVPCVCWGRNAKFAKDLEVGTKLKVKGRFQSRTYTKSNGDEMVEKTAYEVSISLLNEEK